MREEAHTVRLGVDVGGTFTDLVLITETGQVSIEKVLSRPKEGFASILEGLTRMGVDPAAVKQISYGTTIATNSVIERKGARVGMLCTRGFRDVVEHQRWHRRTLYDLHQSRPEPLVARRDRFNVTERVSAGGDVLQEIDEQDVLAALAELEREGMESIAICFLNAHANGSNERKVGDLVKRHWRTAYVSLSSEVAPLIREWERTTTTVVNAYTQPILERHLHGVEQHMQALGLNAHLDIMQSNGGIISVSEACLAPVRTILSGPAGGVIGALLVGQRSHFDSVITLDMGGTSCDVSVIRNGEPEITKEGQVEYNVPITVPMVKIETIGAGGGSIAWIDAGGALKVGPQSAGASPGPVCYGQGGTEPTVTDAHLLLGRLTPAGLLGGRLRLDADLARHAFEERVCPPLHLDVVEAASGVIRIANVLMAEAIRLQTVNKGLDPRDFVLLAFGGAGPLHACEIAAELGLGRVIAPPSPGVLSAFGLGGADAKTGVVRAINRSMGELTAAGLRELYSSLDNQCRQVLDREEIDSADRTLIHSADLRYEEQSFEITVPVANGFDTQAELTELSDAFHRSHRDQYGYAIPEHTPFLVNVEVTAIGRKPKPITPPLASSVSRAVPIATRPVYFLEPPGFAPAAIYARGELFAGHSLQGPAVVEQFDSTVIVPPGWHARADEYGDLILEKDV
jgi:N-methylhydantoinase A